MKKIKNSQPQTKFTGSYKKKEYILYSELIYHFGEIFNITLSVPNLVGDGEIYATCLASNLPDNS